MKEQMKPLAAAVLAVLYPNAAALAQDNERAATRLEPVTVTATRRSEDLQDVAQSVTALSTEFLQKQALTNLNDVVGALPSVNIISSTPGRNSIVMRGISTGSAEYRIDSQVSVYLDDQPMTAISQQVDVRLIDIERVEALPGPQGTLFGSSSQAGTIRYVTNKPDISGFSSQMDVEVGTTKGGDESYDISGWANFPVSDNFAIRAVGYWSEEGGYVDNVLGPTLMGETTNADIVEKNQNVYTTSGGRVAGLWTINPDWNLLVTAIAQKGEADGAWETDPALGDNKITRFFDEYRDDKWYQTSMTLKGDLGFAELALTASYFDRKVDYEWDNTNYNQDRTRANTGYYAAYYRLYDTGTLHGTTFNWQKQSRWAYEARLTSQGDSKFQWMAGAFFEDVYDWWEYGSLIPDLETSVAWDEANIRACNLAGQGQDVACPLPLTDYYYYNKYRNKVKQYAVFGEMSYAITDQWSVTAGGRWFEFDRDMYDLYNVPLGYPAEDDPEGGEYSSSSVDNDSTMKLGTEFHFNDDVMVYGLFSEGFRLGGENSLRAASTGFVPLKYGPDTLKNYELGMKSQWFNDKLQLNASLFFMEWEDIQLHIEADTWWVEGNINGGKAEQKGIELNGVFYPTERLNFEWSIFLADPEFSETTYYPGTDPAIPYIEKGTRMPVSPREKYWAAVEYTFPDFLPWEGDFWTRFSYTYQGRVWDSLSAIQDWENGDASAIEFFLPEWQSGTLQFGFTSENGWDAALVVRNVFDDKSFNYMSSSWYGEDFGDPRWRYLRSLQRPRSVALSFSKKW